MLRCHIVAAEPLLQRPRIRFIIARRTGAALTSCWRLSAMASSLREQSAATSSAFSARCDSPARGHGEQAAGALGALLVDLKPMSSSMVSVG